MKGRKPFAIISIVLAFVIVAATTVFLHGQEQYIPAEKYDGPDVQRSRVYLTGTGYTIDKRQEKTQKKQEKEKEKQKTEEQKEITEKKQPNRARKTDSVKRIERQRSASGSRRNGGSDPAKTNDPKNPTSKAKPGNNSGGSSTDPTKPTGSGRGSTDPATPTGSGGGSTDPTNPTGSGGESTDPTAPTDPSGGGGEEEPDDPDDPTRPSNSGGGGNQISEEERAKKPIITISISNGQRINGTRFSFTVKVTDYKGRNVPVFSESDGSYETVCNNVSLVSEGTSGGKTSFRTDLLDGDNEILVSAVDREGNTSERRIRFVGDTSAEAEIIGEVSVAIEAPILNLGTIHETTVSIHEGDTAKDVLNVAFSEAGITPYFNGGYLSGMGRAGIAQDASIDDSVREIMMERRKTEKDPEKQDKDKLREHDFYDSSGWIYIVNGETPEVGLNSYRMEDGDELHLVFQLDTDIY